MWMVRSARKKQRAGKGGEIEWKETSEQIREVGTDSRWREELVQRP